MTGSCVHCGGSGVLTILSCATVEEVEAPWATRWDERPFLSPCHGCPAGAAWEAAGLASRFGPPEASREES